MIHQQRDGDAVFFPRQAHAGSAFDSRRGQIIVFGSDTHGWDWLNNPFFFDAATLRWSRPYLDDPASSYSANESGVPVAGDDGQHPWAMHTFGAVDYHPEEDVVVVSSYPAHLVPGRFTDAVSGIWRKIRRHPTWVLERSTESWRALKGSAVHFFPYATTYASSTKAIMGYKSDGIFELDMETESWQRLESHGLTEYHNNVVYDRAHDALVVFGSAGQRNDVYVYYLGTRRHVTMPTRGIRPPPDEHNPMAYHGRLERTVVLVDRFKLGQRSRNRSKATTETWLYDLKGDQWTQVGSATLPFGCGMNYNLEYDQLHDALYLITSVPGEPTSVWALKLQLDDKESIGCEWGATLPESEELANADC